MRLFGSGEREVTISRGQAPVEENREAGLVLDVRVPVLQARYAAAALAAVVASAIFLIAALGENVLYAAWFVVGVTTFIWWMLSAMYYTLDPETDGQRVAVTLIDLLVGIAVTLFPGFLAWCLWLLVKLLVPALSFPSWVPRSFATAASALWRTVAPLTSLLAFVFSCSFWLHIELAFIQELGQRSPHQEKSVWDAIGQLIVHHGKKYKPQERTILVRQSGGAKALPKQQKEQTSITAKAAASDESDESDDGQFLSNLEAWIVDGDRIGTYSRAAWTGRILTNGTVVTDGLWREMKDTLVEAGWMTSDNAGTRLNYSLSDVLFNISAPPQTVGGAVR